MKQGTIAFLILLEAALVLGLVYYAVGGYRAVLGEQGPRDTAGADLAGAALTTEGTEAAGTPEDAALPVQTPDRNTAEESEVLPAGMEWGLLSQEDYQCDENGELALYRRYEYDTFGNLARVTYYIPGEWSEEYQYDAQGKQLIRCIRTEASPEGDVRERTYSYEDDRLVRIIFYTNGQIISFLDILYDEEGREWREVSYQPEFIPVPREAQNETVSENEATETASASENASGAEASVSDNEAAEEEPEFIIYSIREHRYDAEGNEIKNWTFFADGKIAGPWEEYEYDEEGRMTALIHRDSDGTLSARETYTYYSEDKVSSVVSTNGDGTLRWRHYRDYDTQGQLIHEEVRDEESLVTWHLYIYDTDGHLLEMHDNAGGLYYNYDEERGLLTETKRHAGVGEAPSAENLTGRTVYQYQPVPIGTALLPGE